VTYSVRRFDGTAGPWTQIATVPAATLTLQNVFNDAGNTSHCWDVFATNSGGDSASAPQQCWTTPAIVSQPPNAPSGPTLAAIGSNQIRLAWQDNSDNETGFQTERNGVINDEYQPNTTGAVDGSLRASTNYAYRIRALGDQGNSAWVAMGKVKTLPK